MERVIANPRPASRRSVCETAMTPRRYLARQCPAIARSSLSRSLATPSATSPWCSSR